MPGAAGFRLDFDGGGEPDPTVGGPCQDDGQCDDGVGCTLDSCDATLGRCRFSPDDARCDDDTYCDGVERCDVRMGCRPGEPVACSDDDTCTIDACVEATRSCRNEPRDADGDGDPTRSCGGNDCDDTNGLVNGAAMEVCGNGRDDDCDGELDEADCGSPEHDDCEAALRVTESGYFDLDLTATKLDYPTPCATEEKGFRDAVVMVVVPPGEVMDIDVTAKLDQGEVTLGTAESCGDAESVSCEVAATTPAGDPASRTILRAAEPGEHPVYLAASVEGVVQLKVELRPSEPRVGETCEQASPLVDGGAPLLVRLPGYSVDARSECESVTGDAFASFTLEEARDVTLVAEAELGLGLPLLSLRGASCRAELTCRKSQPGRLFVRNLGAGTYVVMIGGSGPDDVSVRLETEPVSESPPGEGCEEPLVLEPGVEQVVDLSLHQDAVNPGCLAGAPDAAFEFSLAEPRDVALIGRFSDGDQGAVSITDLECSASQACRSGVGTQRVTRYGLAAGSYRAVIESTRGNPVALSWLERPARAAIHVPFSDDCEQVVTIPESGGRFSGNTGNAFPDFSAGCDVGGQSPGGAPDQILRLRLTEPRRVVLDMQGSAYQTMLSVRAGDLCPGAELPLSCAPGYPATRSYLDLNLQAGDYFVQIDGYDGDYGAWKLDVFTSPL